MAGWLDKAKCLENAEYPEGMRPYVIEVREGPGLARIGDHGPRLWQARCDYSYGQWMDTPWPVTRPLQMVKEDLGLLNFGYIVVCPEREQKARWEDA